MPVRTTQDDIHRLSRAAAIPSDINTLAFVDIETTGLEEHDRIWQLCIVAVTVDDFFGEVPLEERKSFNHFYNPPSEFHPEAARLTGMTNEKLKNYPAIDDKARKELKEFFDSLKPPTCLIAHNGSKFDFPLLVRDFNESVPTSTKVCDSIDLFRLHQRLFVHTSTISYKLKEVYKRFFKDEPIIQHEASHDVDTLIKCLLHIIRCPRMKTYNETLMEYINKYSTTFATIGKFLKR